MPPGPIEGPLRPLRQSDYLIHSSAPDYGSQQGRRLTHISHEDQHVAKSSAVWMSARAAAHHDFRSRTLNDPLVAAVNRHLCAGRFGKGWADHGESQLGDVRAGDFDVQQVASAIVVD